jgi:GA-binding protein alpha chain
VQINVQIQWDKRRINIIDVLKPTDEEVAKYYEKIECETTQLSEDGSNESVTVSKSPSKLSNSKWTVDYSFKNDLGKIGASEDPQEWTIPHVQFWVCRNYFLTVFFKFKLTALVFFRFRGQF